MKSSTPQTTFEELSAACTSKRFLRNLRNVHEVCGKISVTPEKDFSLAAVGRLTQSKGGPGLNTLYTPRKGERFKKLISAWAASTGAEAKKPKAKTKELESEHELLSRISDLVVRSYVGPLLAERRVLLEEVKTLRAVSRGSPTIDLRPRLPPNTLEIMGPPSELTTDELETLTNACSVSWLKSRGLTEGPRGEVLLRDGSLILPRGALPGIRKLLNKRPKSENL